jgi:hypothetical protein
VVILASAKPSGRTMSRTSETLACLPPSICTCHAVPPSKSMPKFRPRAATSAMLSTISVVERISHRLLCLMNW